MWCAADNHNYMCGICAKGVLDSNFNGAVMNKISNFQEFAPKFTYPYSKKKKKKKIIFFKCNYIFLDQLLLPYKFCDSDMQGIYFFIFASCKPLRHFCKLVFKYSKSRQQLHFSQISKLANVLRTKL